MYKHRMIKRRLFAGVLMILSVFSTAAFGQHLDDKTRVFLVTDYGAIGDGKTLNTESFLKAIQACFEAGGGIVRVSTGEFLSGPIALKTGVTLEILTDAILKFTDNFDDYPLDQVRREGIEMMGFIAPISARNAQNIAVIGGGIIDGGGQKWWTHFYEAENRSLPEPVTEMEKKIATGNKGRLRRGVSWFFPRPCLIEFYNCRNILLENFTTRNSPMWTIHPVYCENIIARGLKITGGPKEPNTDGFNPDSCRNILVESCEFATGDDCIAVKSGYNEDGRRVNVPCENIIIRGCIMRQGHGGVAIGSETSGSIRNIKIENCRFLGTDRGIRIKSSRERGGIVENVEVSDIEMKDLTQDAISLTTYYDKKIDDAQAALEPITPTTPVFRNICIRNIRCQGATQAVSLMGLPEMPLQNITFENVHIFAQNPGACRFVQGLKFLNVSISSPAGANPTIENCSEIILRKTP